MNIRRQQSTRGLPVFTLLLVLGVAASGASQTAKPGEEMLILPGKAGVPGGRLVAALRSEPKTLNPVTALDLPSKEVISLLSADLIHTNVYTQQTEPALAKSWIRVLGTIQHHQTITSLARLPPNCRKTERGSS